MRTDLDEKPRKPKKVKKESRSGYIFDRKIYHRNRHYNVKDSYLRPQNRSMLISKTRVGSFLDKKQNQSQMRLTFFSPQLGLKNGRKSFKRRASLARRKILGERSSSPVQKRFNASVEVRGPSMRKRVSRVTNGSRSPTSSLFKPDLQPGSGSPIADRLFGQKFGFSNKAQRGSIRRLEGKQRRKINKFKPIFVSKREDLAELVNI